MISNTIFIKQVLIVILTSLLLACDSANNNEAPAFKCTSDWYELVDKMVQSGDGRGHGPDVGSSEWRSVIEFKLGIRGKPEVPASYTHKWCEYINTHFIESKE